MARRRQSEGQAADGGADRASVEPTPAVASVLLRLLMREALRRHRDGLPTRPDVTDALQQLGRVADIELTSPGSRTMVATVRPGAMGMVSVAEAAARSGKSESYVQRLARTGRVRCQRVGRRSWLVDLESLETVLRRTE